MPAGSSFKAFIEQKLGKFPHFMIYAILEWIMIILLFIDGFLAFISNEFAKFFDLTIPCLLCTRIDHVLVNRDSNFYYNDSMCENHKKDISSLAYCHMHKKLSDIRKMCEGCLLSFATEKDSDNDKYKSLVGILHKDVDCFVEEDRKLLMKPMRKEENDYYQQSSEDIPRWCCCCGEPMRFRSSSKYKRNLSMDAPTPSPRAPLSRNENLELPHIRYTELKFMSDNESEIPEDEVASLIRDNQDKKDAKAATMPLLPDPEDINEDAGRTPTFSRGNKFFGIPLSDSAQVSPRWSNRGSKKLPIDKVDFIVVPNDLSATNDVEGDILNRLKKQVRLDRKSLMALYMELDEERSASAVAANNAMAMISRLQAEKAAVQMEALQYQRMMDEQAEYDQEALQVMKDMLMKKEEDMKALESELDTYRERYGPIKRVGSEICEVDADDDYQDIKSQSMCSFNSDGSGSDQNGSERNVEFGGGNPDESLLDFEGERSHLLCLLTNLEKKISSSSDEGSNSPEFVIVNQEDKGKGSESKGILTREVSMIRERLRAIEAESGFLKHAAMTLQRGDEGTKLLTEIAHHLRKLRHSPKSVEETDA